MPNFQLNDYILFGLIFSFFLNLTLLLSVLLSSLRRKQAGNHLLAWSLLSIIGIFSIIFYQQFFGCVFLLSRELPEKFIRGHELSLVIWGLHAFYSTAGVVLAIWNRKVLSKMKGIHLKHIIALVFFIVSFIMGIFLLDKNQPFFECERFFWEPVPQPQPGLRPFQL